MWSLCYKNMEEETNVTTAYTVGELPNFFWQNPNSFHKVIITDQNIYTYGSMLCNYYCLLYTNHSKKFQLSSSIISCHLLPASKLCPIQFRTEHYFQIILTNHTNFSCYQLFLLVIVELTCCHCLHQMSSDVIDFNQMPSVFIF